ncbi:MAG TPA: helix-turn-helix domain-containing protein [Steroidobacteraceae bacterium]|nr:helix-turn-helix domain-containing protein [Steroidobacteraceae bacterium]
MTRHPSSTVIRAWTRLARAQQIAAQAIERRLKSAGLPALAWYDALLELERAGPAGLRPFELGRELLLSQCNLSRLIDRLEQEKYVERRACQDDGRGQVIVITRAGRGMRRRMWGVYGPAIQSIVGAHLSSAQAASLDTVLGTLISGSRSL